MLSLLANKINNITTMVYVRMAPEVSLLLRYLHQELGETLKRLTELYPQYTKTTIHRHMKKPMAEVSGRDKTGGNGGRPSKGDERDKRKLVSALMKLRETEGNFSATDIQREAGIPEDQMSNRTVRRYLNKMGYRVTQCRRKGILLKEDLPKRLKFARRCKKLSATFWKEGISFYLDGASFVHKTNPSQHARTTRTRTWKKKGEALAQHCTAKGKKEGVGGRVARFMCAISFGRGFTKCHQYTGCVNGETCREFIHEHFPSMFDDSPNPRGKLFLQDGDPSQNSALAREAMDAVGCRLFKIPARSPDLNPIENAFNNIRRLLKRDALDNKITKETYDNFCIRVKRIILGYDSDVIDRTIASMPKRIDLVIKNRGLRTKY